MAFTVPSSVWQLPDVTNAGASFLSATDPFILSPAAGPGTGSRIDLLCVKQNNVENSDADSRANVILVAGTAGAPGTAPAVPAGAWLYQTINVPTAAANAAACTVVTARPTTYGPLPIKSATLALLNTVTGALGQHATVTADTASANGDYYWSGSAWVPSWQRLSNIPSAVFAGAVPPANAHIIEYVDRIGINTNSAGDATFNYPASFPNGIIAVSMDRIGFGTYGTTTEVFNTTQGLGSCNVRIYAGGSIVASITGMPYTYRAIGW